MKVALVHDYLIDYGGAEQVLSALHRIYPKAPIYTLVVDKKGMGKFWKNFSDAEIISSFFNDLPYASKLISPLRFLIPVIWKVFALEEYDLIISSASWAVTKGFDKGKNAKEICYLHTPPRYLYGYDTSRKWNEKWFAKLIEVYALIVNHFMRLYDFKMAQKVSYFIANSQNVGKRIEKFYRREYQIIYPPVAVKEIINSQVKPQKGNYFLTGGRLVASKNFDLIIKACLKAKVNLKIFGDGVERENLEKVSQGKVEFLGKISPEKLISYYKGAKAFLLAQKDEDFGITSVEAQAAGTPVIAYQGGGYLETIINGKTGIFFKELKVDSLVAVLKKFGQSSFKKEDLILNAQKFSQERFVKEIKEFIKSKIK